MQCNQENCERDGTHIFTWPGRDERAICDEHLPFVIAASAATGVSPNIKPIISKSGECPACEAEWPTIAIIAAGNDAGAEWKGTTISVVLSIRCPICNLTFGSVVTRTLSQDAEVAEIGDALQRAGVPR